jgi:1-deoxy-D-xylulose-5-phosphate synthase
VAALDTRTVACERAATGRPEWNDEATPGRGRPGDSLFGLTPAALRAMDGPALTELVAAIRTFLVTSVAANGGHLGSNLGVVELTVALHRVFDSPRDRIVWDTGHQTYVHKIVTGRAGRFPGLRRADGLSGYANRGESVHDLVENSHASTALSYAYGLARARDLRHGSHRVVAVVGDGGLTGGLAYEALSNIGTRGTPVVIVLNDNGRSYAPTVSNLTTAARPAGDAADPAAFFTALGLAYEGPVDGHDLGALDGALRRVASASGPVVLHVHTQKGRGYLPAERDEEKRLHDIGPFDPASGRAHAVAGAAASYTEAFGTALVEAATVHPELVAITAAMPGSCGLLEFARRFPDRFIDVGMAEQHAVTTAAGLALDGFRPVVAIYSTFLNRAWDQLYYDVGLHRLPVIFCIDRAGITGDDGPSHNGVLDLALLTKVPGMTVLAPSSYEEVAVMLAQAIAVTSGPVAIRWPKTAAPRRHATGVAMAARRVRAGSDICFLGLGKMLEACERAADVLGGSGVEATVWDIRAASPLDPLMLADAARHQVVITVEDGIEQGGVGSTVAGILRSQGAPGAGASPVHPAAPAAPAVPVPPAFPAVPVPPAFPAVPVPPAFPVVETCGLPLDYFPQGRADEILAGLGLGLDGQALAQRALALWHRSLPVRP